MVSTTSARTSRRICIASIAFIEFPRYQGFAQAFPNTIPYSEGIGFLYGRKTATTRSTWPTSSPRTSSAHQWWAHQVVGGNGQGSTMFSEGLAEYSALTVMEKRFGREAAQKFLRRELDGYLRGRGNERKKEVPLLYVENQPYIHYQKGSLAFYALRDYIGEDRDERGAARVPRKSGRSRARPIRRRAISTRSSTRSRRIRSSTC